MDENCIKLILIYQLLKNQKCFSNEITAILKDDFNVNYKLPSNICTVYNQSQYSGCTALHFMVEFDNFNSLNLFIEHGADLTIQNFNGYTPLLLAFHKSFPVDKLISTYVKNKIFTNIKDKNGISHFHVACLANNIQAVDLYLEADSSVVHERVNDDSPKYSGYTPLHFAVLYDKLQTMELLLANGANLNSEDANGTTPLHMLLKKCKKSSFDPQIFLKIFPLAILPDNMDFTYLHINCTMNYASLFKKFLNQDIDIDSPIKFHSLVWPGYTPLHVASQFNLSTVLRLLEKEANLLAKDASGMSPLDLCLKQYKLDEIIQILSMEKRHHLSQIEFTDGTPLLNVLRAMKNNEFHQFIETKIKNINIIIPFNSPIWAGYNLLHLAVMFDQSESFLVPALLSCNVNFTILNAYGMSPLHLAFYFEKEEIVRIILDLHEKISVNPVDQNNLSHLHIACIAQNLNAVEFLLNSGSDPNLPLLRDIQSNFNCLLFDQAYLYKMGTTPFDIAVSWIDDELMDKIPIVKNNLDINPDLAFSFKYGKKKKQRERIIDLMLNPEVKALITNKMSIKILSRVTCYSFGSDEIITNVIDKLINEMQYKKLGITKLQVACALGKLFVVKKELVSGVDVNQQIALDSEIWPGDTALHINSRREESASHISRIELLSPLNFRREEFPSRASRVEIAKLLLAHGANPNLKNANNLTPIHMSNNLELEAVMLLSNKTFPIVNPVNNDGLSHFHLSCKTNFFYLVEKFIKSGVSVHTPVNYFADLYAGYTPLHFAVQYGSKEVIQLLLSQGANPNVKNADGLTPIYLAVTHNVNQDRIEALLRSPAMDIENTDMTGKPLLIKALENISGVMKSNDSKFIDIKCKIDLLLRKGYHMSFAHVIVDGHIQTFMNAATYLPISTFLEVIKNISNITDDDEKGQNIMHYVSKYSFQKLSVVNNINLLVKLGCEINHKDKRGKTPLHKVIDHNCQITANLLLLLGADVNIKDDEGKTPLIYAIQKCNEKDSDSENNSDSECDLDDRVDFMMNLLIKNIMLLKEVGLFVDKLNQKYFNGSEMKNANRTKEDKQKFENTLKKEVSSSFSVDYFFSEQFEVDYKRIPVLQRQAICNICDSGRLLKEFPKLHSLIRLQFRKARSRIRLLEPAKDAFQALLSIGVPDLCLESILKYLNNDDLMNLVRSGNEKLIFAPLCKNY